MDTRNTRQRSHSTHWDITQRPDKRVPVAAMHVLWSGWWRCHVRSLQYPCLNHDTDPNFSKYTGNVKRFDHILWQHFCRWILPSQNLESAQVISQISMPFRSIILLEWWSIFPYHTETQCNPHLFCECITSFKRICGIYYHCNTIMAVRAGVACRQCSEADCCSAFHVLCAHKAGCHCRLEVSGNKADISSTALCLQHSAAGSGGLLLTA